MATSSGIVQSYLNTFGAKEMDKLCHEKNPSELLHANRKAKGGDFLIPLNYYLGILESTDEVMFAYMSDEQKKSLLHSLQTTYLLLLAEQQYEKEHGQHEHIKKYNHYLEQCRKLIDAINISEENKLSSCLPSPEQGWLSDGNPCKYLYIYFAKYFGDKIVEFADRKTKTIKEAMAWFNDKRLYWVWGSSLLLSVLELIPKDFFNTQQATDVVKAPGPYTGALSWGLYYFRFSLNLSLLLKHTIAGPWMCAEEKKLPWTERFQTQWAQRKFDLLNDSLWATCNILCYFVLNSKNALGPWGDLLTLALLIFDISLSVWNFEEQKVKYTQEIKEFELQISILESKKKQINLLGDPDNEQLLQCEQQLQHLKRAQKLCKKEWSFKEFGLITDIAYAVGLMLAFTVLTTPFLPVSGPVVMAVGAVFCFASMVIYKTIKNGADIYKTMMSSKEAKQEYQEKTDALKELLSKYPDAKDNEKKFLFLEIQKLKAETAYQKQLVVYQIMHFFRSIIIEVITPAIIFASFVFLPLGAGFGSIGIGLALAVFSNLLINAVFKPNDEDKNKKLDAFDQEQYDLFCEQLNEPGRGGFFSPSKNNEGEDSSFDNNKPSFV